MQTRRIFGLLVRRERWVPSIWGWLLVLIVALGLAIIFIRAIHPFLALNRPVHGEILVVEGWLPDYALEQAIEIFRRQSYSLLVTTGVEIEKGFQFSQMKTEAEFARVRLLDLGLPADSVVAVPAPPEILTDRTYESAIAFADWLKHNHPSTKAFDLVSLGAHSRRSRLLFARAVGDSVKVGIISLTDKRYDPNRWWVYSGGVKMVLEEVVGYAYALVGIR